MGYSKDEVIADVLDHYEVHLEYLHQHRATRPYTTAAESVPAKAGLGHRLRHGDEPVAALPKETP